MTAGAPSQSDDVAVLIAKLGEQRELYRQLKVLSDRQADLIAAGDAEPLLDILSQRQQLVDELGRLNGEIAPLRDRWPQLAPTLDDSQRQQVNGLLDEVEHYLQAIIEQDDKDRQQLQTAKQRVGGELRQLNQSGQAVSAYRNAPKANAPRFTDRQG